MAEPHIVTTLRTKRDELDRLISSYEGALAAARRDFVNINATLELFERDGAPTAYLSRLSIVRMFKRGEIFTLCKSALAEALEGLILAKRMDENDSVLRKAIGFRIVQVMLRQRWRGNVADAGKRKGVRVWRQVTNSASSDTKDNARRWNQLR